MAPPTLAGDSVKTQVAAEVEVEAVVVEQRVVAGLQLVVAEVVVEGLLGCRTLFLCYMGRGLTRRRQLGV